MRRQSQCSESSCETVIDKANLMYICHAQAFLDSFNESVQASVFKGTNTALAPTRDRLVDKLEYHILVLILSEDISSSRIVSVILLVAATPFRLLL